MKWIDVCDSLPKDDENVIVYYEIDYFGFEQKERGCTGLGFRVFYKDTGKAIWYSNSGGVYSGKILYWMPLPGVPSHKSRYDTPEEYRRLILLDQYRCTEMKEWQNRPIEVSHRCIGWGYSFHHKQVQAEGR